MIAFDGPEAFGSVAVILRETRESFGEELRAVAQSLRIRFVYLQAIEDGRFDDLPGHTYAVGFIRTYAEYLGLDGEDMVNRFKEEVRGLERRTELVFPTPVPEGKIPGGAVILLSLVLVGLAYGGWFYLSNQGQTVADLIPEVPDRLQGLLGSEGDPVRLAGSADPGSETAGVPSDEPAVAESEPSGPVSETPAEAGETSLGSAPEPSADSVIGPAIAAVPDELARAPRAPEPPAPDQALQPALEPVTTAERPAAPADRLPDVATATVAAPGGETPVSFAAVPPSLVETQSETAGPSPVPDPAVSAAADGDRGSTQDQAAGDAISADEAPPADAAGASGMPAPVGSLAEVIARNAAGAAQPGQNGSLSSLESPRTSALGASASGQAATNDIPQAPSTAQLALSQAGSPRIYGSDNANARIVLRAKFDSWVQVRDDQDTLLLTRVLRAGDSYRVPNQSGLTLLTGNAGGLEIEVDGRTLAPLGPIGSVKRNIALDPSSLVAGAATR